ncbi:MAG TPA: BTAD domain-containing putative transcriptional regulator [Euzebyales bacterium]|nr:BTAD domain-containing putative transcriptional regulator [Euzebyales bacterium]
MGTRDPAAAAACFEEALGLWRGDALAEFADVAPLAADGVPD